jgi:hypothetical protein
LAALLLARIKRIFNLTRTGEERITTAILNEIVSASRNNRARVLFVYLPTFLEAYRQPSSPDENFLTRYCIKNKIPFLNLKPIFFREPLTRLRRYYNYSGHWTQLGHQIAAQAIEKEIADY